MQQWNSYTCGWWSLYFLLASNNLNSVLPELFYFNIPEINKTFLYNFFKHYAIDWNCQNVNIVNKFYFFKNYYIQIKVHF